MNKISCVAIDVMNADKPPASLAFLAGACEQTQKDYICVSLNSYFLKNFSSDDYHSIYNNLKIGNVDSISENCIMAFDEIIQQIVNFKTEGILISVFSHMQIPLATLFLTQLKKYLPNIPVIAGGPGIIFVLPDGKTFGKSLVQQGLIDFYCLGEGDEVLPAWLQGNHDVLGLNSKQTRYESWVPQIDDLDSKYLVPSYKNIDVSNYKNIEGKQGTVFSLSTSRGCVRDCSFCDVANTWKKFRFRNGKNTANEVLKHHRDVGAVHFTIVDSLINGSLKSFLEFNQEMIKLKQQYSSLKNFSYNGMFIVRDKKTHTEKLFATMAEAGCDSLSIGVETGSDRLRTEINKKFTNEDLDYHLEMCQRYGIRNAIFTFVGYPTETQDDFEQTLNMLRRYQKYLLDDTIIGLTHTGIFNLLPGTPIFEKHEELGITWHHIDNDRGDISWTNVNNPELTSQERIRRDLEFRKLAVELRYPIPGNLRYLEYLEQEIENFEEGMVPLYD